MGKARGIVGIMAHSSKIDEFPPFAEKAFYRQLCLEGQARGLLVYVFSPSCLDEEKRLIRGFSFDMQLKAWVEEACPLPDLIYDRYFQQDDSDGLNRRSLLRKLYTLKPFLFLGWGLKSKWEMFVYLRRDSELQQHLPATARLADLKDTAGWLSRRSRVILKPEHGSQGKGVIQLEQRASTYTISGRDHNNNLIDACLDNRESMQRRLTAFINGKNYLIQQYLELHSVEGKPWDIRCLIQKNGSGHWQLTGMAVRQGSSNSITSNLHGGGVAYEADPFLIKQFGQNKATAIRDHIERLSRRIPPVLEASNGRMAELGVDFGVDCDGRLWIIEVNTKPGRSIFRRLGLKDVRRQAERNPAAYAHYLLSRNPHGFGSEVLAGSPLIHI